VRAVDQVGAVHTDPDEGNENSHSSSSMLNTNVNNNLSKKVNNSDGKNLLI
jgi:hypothetical protein